MSTDKLLSDFPIIITNRPKLSKTDFWKDNYCKRIGDKLGVTRGPHFFKRIA